MVSIRRANTSDIQKIWMIHRSSILKCCSSHYTPDQLSRWTAVLKPERYAEHLTIRESLVAEEDGEIIGFGILDAANALVNATYINPKSTGKGVGRQLMEAMEELARQKNVKELTLNATLNAVGFYMSIGYSSIESSVNRLPDGTELPCVVMKKHLR